jgi:hypothetical protein
MSTQRKPATGQGGMPPAIAGGYTPPAFPPYSGPRGRCPSCGQPAAGTQWHWAGPVPADLGGPVAACPEPGATAAADAAGEHVCRTCGNCGHRWAEACTLTAAQALRAIAPLTGCGLLLVCAGDVLLTAGAGCALDPFLSGAALAGTWAAVTLAISLAVGCAYSALTGRPSSAQDPPASEKEAP